LESVVLEQANLERHLEGPQMQKVVTPHVSKWKWIQIKSAAPLHVLRAHAAAMGMPLLRAQQARIQQVSTGHVLAVQKSLV
jgi:hypothetical protein